MEVFDLSHCLEYAGCAIVLAALLLLCSVKPMAILQQCGYKNGKLFRWYTRKDNMLFQRYLLLALMLVLTTGLLGVCFAFVGAEWAARITWIPFVFFCVLFYFVDKKYALKVPVNETERLKRLALVHFVLLAVVCYFFISLLNVIAFLAGIEIVGVWKYVPLSFMPLLLLPVLALANLCDRPYENAHNKKYVTHAREKLQKSDGIKIGVTGSFGKTSVKNILAAMLREKYTVLATPASYNTPMGIAKCVNEYDGAPYEVFIAEMGARKEGDIAELCALVQPRHAIVTGICGQHLESFGSLEKVIRTKGEIVGGTLPGGTVVIGRDENTDAIPSGEGRTFRRVGSECIRDLSCTQDGVSFTLVLGGGEMKIRTKLLGAHTAMNIALAAALALELGVDAGQIVSACEKLDYIPHRLQVIKKNGVTILDDSYNANVKGAAEAVEALRLFSGRKIVVTPGIVELGILEETENAALGARLVGLDEVILVGDTLVGAVKNGYLEAGGDEAALHTAFNLTEATKLLSSFLHKGDVVLFLNDLPDVC